MSQLTKHAREELQRAGALDEDADYAGQVGRAALELIELFAKQGHSGESAAMTLALFGKLARYEPLTPITSDPSEWGQVSEDPPYWQNIRDPYVFSTDGGKTWYHLDEVQRSEGARSEAEEIRKRVELLEAELTPLVLCVAQHWPHRVVEARRSGQRVGHVAVTLLEELAQLQRRVPGEVRV